MAIINSYEEGKTVFLGLLKSHHSYFDRFHNALVSGAKQAGVDLNKLSEEDPKKVCALAQRFWECLPDSSSIRTEPFYTICDVAEFYCNYHQGDWDVP